MSTIRVVSVQNKEIYNILSSNFKYELSTAFFRDWGCPLSFNKLVSKLGFMPIFSLYKFEHSYVSNLKEIDFLRLKYFGINVNKSSIILLLDVPENEAIFTDYYNWSDCLFFEQEGYIPDIEPIFKIGVDSVVQVLLKRILLDWVVDFSYCVETNLSSHLTQI